MKRNLLLLVFSTTFITVLFFSGCTKDVGKLPPAPVSSCDTITYTKHIKPLIDNYCINCHGVPPNPGAPLLTTYDDVKNNSSKIQATVLNPNPTPELMPQGGPPLPEPEKALIRCWLSNGMKQ